MRYLSHDNKKIIQMLYLQWVNYFRQPLDGEIPCFYAERSFDFSTDLYFNRESDLR